MRHNITTVLSHLTPPPPPQPPSSSSSTQRLLMKALPSSSSFFLSVQVAAEKTTKKKRSSGTSSFGLILPLRQRSFFSVLPPVKRREQSIHCPTKFFLRRFFFSVRHQCQQDDKHI